MKHNRKNPLLIAIALVGFTLTMTPVHAASGTWTGGGSQTTNQGIWGGVGNWVSSAVADGAGFTATFGNSFTNGNACIVNTARTIGNITFNSAAIDFNLNTHASNFILTLNNSGASPAINVTQASRTLTINPIVAGTAGLTKSGPGKLLLTNSASTLTGAIIVSGGTLEIGTAGRLGNGTAYAGNVSIASGTTFHYNSSGNTTLAGIISGDGTFTKANSGALTLSNTNTFTTATSINSGTLELTGTGSINSSSGISVNGSTAKFLHSSSVAVTPSVALTQGTVTGSGSINTVNVANAAGNVVSNNNGTAGASLTIGTLNFAGAATVNTFSSSIAPAIITTNLSSNAAGVITINPSALSWTNGSTYDLISYGGGSIGGAGFPQFVLGTVTGLSGRQNTPTLTNSGTALTLSITGDQAYWAGDTDNKWNTTTINNWKLLSNNNYTTFLAAGDDVVFNDNASGVGDVTVDIDLANVSPAATLFNHSNTRNYTLSSTGSFGIASGSVTKNGNGTLTLSTTNTYSGATTIQAGTVVLSGSGNLGSGSALTMAGGKLDLGTLACSVGAVAITAPATSGATIENGDLTGTSYAASNAAGNVIISANLLASGSAGFTKSGAGSLTLSGANTYTGNTNVTAGSLNITGSITGLSASSKLNLNPTAGNVVVNYNGGSSTLQAVTGASVLGTASVLEITGGNLTISPGVTTGTQSVTGTGHTGTGAYGCYRITTGTLRDNGRFTMTGRGTVAAETGPASGLQTAVVFVGGSGLIDQTSSEWWLNYSLGQVTVADSGIIDRTGSSQPFGLFMDHSSGISGGGYGVLNVAGAGAEVLLGTPSLRFGNSTTAGLGEGQSGFVNIAAGTLSAGGNVSTSLPSNPSTINNAYFNFAGGTIKATANLSGFIPASNSSINVNSTLFGAINNNGSANDFAGGVVFDTNDYSVTLPTILRSASGVGVTQADLTISGGSDYVGPPAVIFSSADVIAGGSPAAGYAVINGGAVTEIVITAPGTYTSGTIPTITLIGGGGSGASVTASALTTANGTGGLTKSSLGTLILTGANTYTGPTLVTGGTLQLNGSAATSPTTSSITVNVDATLSFTSGTASDLNLAGKTLTLAGGSASFDIGSAGVNDSITVGNFNLTGNSTLSLSSIGIISSGTSYTLLTSTNPINTGGFTLTAAPIGRLSLNPTINSNTITINPILSEGGWNQSGGGNWSTSGNWSGYVPTLIGDAALFGPAITAPSVVAVDTAQNVGYLRFNNANAYTIGANGSSNLSIDNGAATATVVVDAGAHTIAENVYLASNTMISLATGTSLSISGELSGIGSIELLNAGELILSGSNFHTGATTIQSGTISLSGSGTLGSSAALRLNGGKLDLGSTSQTVGAVTVTAPASSGDTIGNGNLTGSSYAISNASGEVSISANLLGTGAFTKTGAGTAILSGNNTFTGLTTVAAGTLTLTGNRTVAATANPSLDVGSLGSPSATLNIQGNLALGGSQVRVGTNGPGTINQSAGQATFTGGSQLTVGITAGMPAFYNLSGGSLSTVFVANRGIIIGTNTNTTATFQLSDNGIVTMAPTSVLMIGRSENTTATGISAAFYQTGGTATVGELRIGGNTAANNANQTALLDLSAGIFNASTFTALSGGNASVSTINIGGTADVTLPAFPTTRGTGAVATINFDGGTLRPKATSTSYMGGLTNAFIKDGGVTFNTDFNITVSQSLLTDPVSLGGGLTKNGGNTTTLTLSGTNTYTGGTTINNGRVAISTAAALSSGAITIAGDATVGGQLYVSGTPTISNNFSISGVGYPDTFGSCGAIRPSSGSSFTGDITLTGDSRIGFLVTNASTTLTGKISGAYGIDFYHGAGANAQTATFTLQNEGIANDYSGHTSITNIDYAAASTYTGSKNILKLGASQQIPNGTNKGNLVFKGTDAEHQTIFELNAFNETLNGVSNVSPAGAVIRNTSIGASILTIGDGDTTSSFSGVITEAGSGSSLSLTKTGSGVLTLSGANSYSGATTVSAGTLALVGGNQASPVTVSSGASLGFTLGSPTTSSSTFNLSAGTIKITGTPTLASYDLITSSAGVTGTPVLDAPISGYALEVSGNSLKLVQTGGYSTWASVNAIGSNPDQDKDADGVSNAVEYVLGGDKDTNDLSKLPTLSTSGGNMIFSFKRIRSSIDGATTSVIEVGTGLDAWPNSYNVGTTTALSSAGVTVAEDVPTGFDTITLTLPMVPDAKKFGRLKVSVTP